MLNWTKKGLLFSPTGQFGWMNSHAQVPTALLLKDKIRVYFSTRPKAGLSLTTFVDLDRNNPEIIRYVHDKPILELGTAGLFDEHGIMPSSVVEHNGLIYLYYSGWQQSIGVPYNNYTGLAISEDGGRTFKKYSPGPILDRKPFEPYSATSPHVIKRAENNWLMIYCSGVSWLEIGGKKEHVYDLKIALSKDGIHWVQTGKVAIEQRNAKEAITKPTFFRASENLYKMWFCFRGSDSFRDGNDAYKIGYAESSNGESWVRMDEKAGITPASSGWDSSMIAYPSILELEEKFFLFYNGNSFGKAGFGYAVSEKTNSQL